MNTNHEGNVKLTLPFDTIDRAMLHIAGGKAANLGELVRAGLPVPPGFCLRTTTYELVTEDTGLDPILDDLAKAGLDDSARLAELTAATRAACGAVFERRTPQSPATSRPPRRRRAQAGG